MYPRPTYNSRELQEYYDAYYNLHYALFSNWDPTFTKTNLVDDRISLRAAHASRAGEKANIPNEEVSAANQLSTEAAIARVSREGGPYRMCWLIAGPSPNDGQIRVAKGVGEPPLKEIEGLSHLSNDLQNKQTFLHVYWHDGLTAQEAYGLACHLIDIGEL